MTPHSGGDVGGAFGGVPQDHSHATLGARGQPLLSDFRKIDFLKIVLPLWWEHDFEGSDPPKIGPESDSERQRQEKSIKIASVGVSGRTFSTLLG